MPLMSLPDPATERPVQADALPDLSAVEAVDAMRRGDLKAEDYAAALLERTARCAALNAFRTLDANDVLAAAREADRQRLRGRPPGKLHGLPIPVKDSINTRRLPTSNGARLLAHHRPRGDAGVLQPLFGAGALLLGKTNLHELSCGWTSNNAAFGAVLNPYDPSRTPGGSSGGSAVAVASRMAPLALGEDTFGSIRVPATFCGVAGLRPTHERYPNDGVMPLSRGRFDQVGPLARSVADLALFDEVLTRADGPIAALPLAGIRIGVSPQRLVESLDPACERLYQDALRRLRAAGATIVAAEVPALLAEASATEQIILNQELLGSIADYLEAQEAGVTLDALIEDAGPNLRPVFAAGRRPGPHEAYAAALGACEEIRAAAAAYFREHSLDALAFPPTLMPALTQGDSTSVTLAGRPVDLFTAIGRNVAIGSCADLASLVLPMGLAGGLPVGLEFDAPSGSDRRLLAFGLSLEKALGPIAPPPSAVDQGASRTVTVTP
ncbi:MAG: amidase family protein [Steroidobacteraceae bacterium]